MQDSDGRISESTEAIGPPSPAGYRRESEDYSYYEDDGSDNDGLPSASSSVKVGEGGKDDEADFSRTGMHAEL